MWVKEYTVGHTLTLIVRCCLCFGFLFFISLFIYAFLILGRGMLHGKRADMQGQDDEWYWGA